MSSLWTRSGSVGLLLILVGCSSPADVAGFAEQGPLLVIDEGPSGAEAAAPGMLSITDDCLTLSSPDGTDLGSVAFADGTASVSTVGGETVLTVDGLEAVPGSVAAGEIAVFGGSYVDPDLLTDPTAVAYMQRCGQVEFIAESVMTGDVDDF